MRERLVCTKEHFDSYFRFSVGDDILPREELKDIIAKAADTAFVQATFRAALSVARKDGTTKAKLLLDELNETAAVVGGCTISLGFAAKLALAYADPSILPREEPWYQYAIDALSMVLAPLVGAYVSESATDMHRYAQGVGGIARWHFLWLWLAAYWYGVGLIAPVGRIYAVSDEGFIPLAVTLLINAVPALALAIPGYYGLAFLAGHHGENMHPAGRSLVGGLVLVSGFAVGAVIQFGWYWIFEKIRSAIFG